MKELEVIIQNKYGIHLRPSALFVDTALKFKSQVKIKKGELEVDGKSIFNLLMLEACQNTKLIIEIEGDDEEEALKALYELVMIKKFNEE